MWKSGLGYLKKCKTDLDNYSSLEMCKSSWEW